MWIWKVFCCWWAQKLQCFGAAQCRILTVPSLPRNSNFPLARLMQQKNFLTYPLSSWLKAICPFPLGLCSMSTWGISQRPFSHSRIPPGLPGACTVVLTVAISTACNYTGRILHLWQSLPPAPSTREKQQQLLFRISPCGFTIPLRLVHCRHLSVRNSSFYFSWDCCV